MFKQMTFITIAITLILLSSSSCAPKDKDIKKFRAFQGEFTNDKALTCLYDNYNPNKLYSSYKYKGILTNNVKSFISSMDTMYTAVDTSYTFSIRDTVYTAVVLCSAKKDEAYTDDYGDVNTDPRFRLGLGEFEYVGEGGIGAVFLYGMAVFKKYGEAWTLISYEPDLDVLGSPYNNIAPVEFFMLGTNNAGIFVHSGYSRIDYFVYCFDGRNITKAGILEDLSGNDGGHGSPVEYRYQSILTVPLLPNIAMNDIIAEVSGTICDDYAQNQTVRNISEKRIFRFDGTQYHQIEGK
jgi:hypothetical protein